MFIKKSGPIATGLKPSLKNLCRADEIKKKTTFEENAKIAFLNLFRANLLYKFPRFYF